ncbi:helix-turn-helix transcriptional regulator [Leucobacter insecticola]|uniref:Helix-turn-helix transcriptional regulator n=1 Tax=Leucobacter insecticola TaxID=2714934 RepID=A0A6G8FGW4_9MICO|nr:helix-turn-helix transcriptional regulator [Leucobacter insecticola]QIM15608.1 helix-turn-helix transcriptional regulator [Leucobacter insecticola]
MSDRLQKAVETPQLASAPGPAKPRSVVFLPLWRHLLGDELRRLRHERGETLEETARHAGVSPQYLSEMERGVKDPSSEMIAAVAGALRVTLVDLTRAVSEHAHGAPAARAAQSLGSAVQNGVCLTGLALAA